jgi:hypothetical protein
MPIDKPSRTAAGHCRETYYTLCSGGVNRRGAGSLFYGHASHASVHNHCLRPAVIAPFVKVKPGQASINVSITVHAPPLRLFHRAATPGPELARFVCSPSSLLTEVWPYCRRLDRLNTTLYLLVNLRRDFHLHRILLFVFLEVVLSLVIRTTLPRSPSSANRFLSKTPCNEPLYRRYYCQVLL